MSKGQKLQYMKSLKEKSVYTKLFISTLDTTTTLEIMTIQLWRNLRLRGNTQSQIMQE